MSRTCERFVAIGVFAGLMVLVGAGTLPPAFGAEPIRIGSLLSKTGGGADWGKKMEVAAQIAVEEINAKGGVNGSKLELIVKDTGTDYQRAVALLRDLAVQDRAQVILGPAMSGEQNVVFPMANKLEIPIFGSTGAAEGIAARNRPWSFKNTVSDAKMLGPAIDAFIKKYKIRKVALVQDTKDGWSVATAKILPAMYKERGVQVVNESNPISWETGAIDFTAQVGRLKELKPDGLAIAAIYGEVASFAREMQKQGLNLKGADGSGIYASEFIVQGGKAVEGWVVASSFWPDNPAPNVSSFVKKFRARAAAVTPKNPEPTWADGNTYDAIYILADVLRRQKVTGGMDLKTSRQLVKEGLQNVKNFPGVTGSTSIGPDGEGVKQTYVLIIKDGRFQRFE